MDLDHPQGDGLDHSGDNVKLESEPRGFFADQFEVGFPHLRSAHAISRVFPVDLFTSMLGSCPRPCDGDRSKQPKRVA